MSRQFYALTIQEVTATTPCLDHDGHQFDEIKKGTLFATDAEGDWFIHTGPVAGSNPGEWPRFEQGKGISLFRDYWEFVAQASEMTESDPRAIRPRIKALLAAPKRLVKGNPLT